MGPKSRWLGVPAALAGVLSAALLGVTSARASSGCNVHYWWTPFNSPSAWVDAVVTRYSPLSCSTSPALVRFPGGSEVVGVVPTLAGYRVYRNDDGSPNWVAGGIWPFVPGIPGPPSAISYGGGAEYAFPFGNGVYGQDLWYGWMPYGYPGPGGYGKVTTGSMLEPWAPGMARTSVATEIAATGIDFSLRFYWNFDGSPNWGSEQVTGIWQAFDAPSVTADDATTQVAAIGPGGSLWFYWIVNGTTTWYPEQVAGPGSVANGQSMTHSNGAIEIAAAAPDGSLWFWWAADGTGTWHAERVAGPGSVSGTPSMTGAAGAMEIAATGGDGSLKFWWVADGTATWHQVLMSGPGTTFSSPSMVASGSTFEIASLTQ